MKRWNIFCLCLLSVSLPCSIGLGQESWGDVPRASESVVAERAELRLLADDFEFTEGPAADADGNVYFTDQPNDAIHRWSVDGQLSTFLQPAGRSNGLYFDLNGDLLACADAENELWSIRPDGTHRVIVDQFEDRLLNGPNDLWVHPSGAVYFTDPYYRRPYWQRGDREQPVQGVYRLSPDRSQWTLVEGTLRQPNGIIGDAERGVLYVADIGDGKTYRYEIAPDGTLENRTLFCSAGSDGMTIDAERNLYLTGRDGVMVFDAEGNHRETIRVPESWTANVTFGGADRRTLFITAMDSLYAIEMRTRGL